MSAPHDGSQWQSCEHCSVVRTRFIDWLRQQIGVRGDASTEDFKTVIESLMSERAAWGSESETLRRVLGEIAKGHPDPVSHAMSALSSLNSERSG